ncbi:MAG: aspartyl protease family protein [Pyrinomonadaceae bacterium]
MRYGGIFFRVLNLPFHLGLRLGHAFLLLLIASTTFYAASTFVDKPDEVKKLINEASKLTRAGLLPEAEATLRKAIEINTRRSDAKVELAYVYVKQRRLRDAYDLCFPIAQAEPKNARARSVLGATLLTAGRFHEARLVFYAALKLNRNEDLAWAGFGMLDFYENQISNSLDNLREAVFQAPDEPDYLFALAQVSARSEKYKEAAEAYNQFLLISKSTDSDRRARIRGLINFLRYLGDIGGLYTSDGKDQASIPFELIGNRPIVKLRVNNSDEQLRFVLDTGSGISVLSDVAAKKLSVKPITKGGFARGIGGDGKFEIIYGLLKKIQLGDVNIRNVPIYIRKFHSDGQQIDGYVGLALISKFLTTIDYGNQTLSLTKKEADKREFRENDELSLPLRLTSSGFLSGEVQLDGIDSPLNFIVDTGASVSVISNGVSKAAGISPFVSNEKMRVVGAAGITDDVATFLLPRVTFGKNSSEDIMAVALDLDIINEASGFEQAGILGGNFLKNYRLTFDFKNSKVTFVAIRPEKE